MTATHPAPPEIQPERLARFQQASLKHGAHSSIDEGGCVMEWTAFLAGKPHTDSPPCVCHVLGYFMRNWNDGLPSDADRDRLLKPFALRLIGTKSTPEIELRRGFMAFDWLARVQTPAWMDLTPSLTEHAAKLRALPELDSTESIDAALPTIQAAQESAAAAGAAARDAAGDAARDAARAALAPTVATLQASAVDLLDRMIAVGGAE